MADEARGTWAADHDKTWGEKHHEIVASEIAAINKRREATRLRLVEGIRRDRMIDVVGLSLSGGGIRSAATCLGVLQALNHHDLIKRIDYLSTVSGGGYIGSSLTATMTRTKEFVFSKETAATGVGEIVDTLAVGHIRNYSNYLIPGGARDLLTGMAIIVRGLVANLGFMLPVVLVLAAVTIWSTPVRSCMDTYPGEPRYCEIDRFWPIGQFGFGLVPTLIVLLLITYLTFRSGTDNGRRIFGLYVAGTALGIWLICYLARSLPVDHFAATWTAFMLGLALFFVWALVASLSLTTQEFRAHPPTMGAIYLVLVPLIGFVELQPFMIDAIFLADAGIRVSHSNPFLKIGVAVTGGITSLTMITVPIAVAVMLFRQQFTEALKGNSVSSEIGSRALAIAAKLAIWLAGAALPLLIWVGYLHLSYWGIANDTERVTPTSHAPGWLVSAVEILWTKIFGPPSGWVQPRQEHIFGWFVAALYAAAALVLFALSWILTPNANSLHRLYRNRLCKAFLFDPKSPAKTAKKKAADSKPSATGEPNAPNQPSIDEPSIDQGRDFLGLDPMKLSELCPEGQLEAPYHLINTALNIQGSDYANRRGRNADFFLFSPLNVGSEATGYAKTVEFEKVEPDFRLATAMAISGAAISSNMGSSSVRPLTPTLALLNVRLGYWLTNPRYISASSKVLRHRTPPYIWSEVTGRLYENSTSIYLTDGGHIENLGVYELLRRRCKVIIAVDADADATMNFSALMTLQRYARIDLGIRINLPWMPIQTRTLELTNWRQRPPTFSTSQTSAPAGIDGPHVAIGIIDYGDGEKGYLVYIKSSLTGDENDYIRDYARRHPRFPHESTDDQFFTEEQFEVYRALGSHMVREFLLGHDDVVAAVDGGSAKRAKFSDGSVESIKQVRAALGLAVEPVPASKA